MLADVVGGGGEIFDCLLSCSLSLRTESTAVTCETGDGLRDFPANPTLA